MLKVFLIALIPITIIGIVVSNAIITIYTAKALKLGKLRVKWVDWYGSILNITNAGFSVDLIIPVENPTANDITLDYIKLECQLNGISFSKINYTSPILVKAKSNKEVTIRVKSASVSGLLSVITNLLSKRKIPTSIHLRGELSANTWKATINDDYNIIGK